MTTTDTAPANYYVYEGDNAYGPYSYDDACWMQNKRNATYGTDSDGEGYCNAIVVFGLLPGY